ncbi:Fe-S protein assembly co-chaperone HscB [Rubrivivax albus]|uniref:Co-chaperone protein HscB homolog n=1 Tax=Rubrivivax albus TaxID=2499835 RepID=A0A3S3SFF1_9BURK|nr:Fe-S protein assembly co-chaperone HscB [Rubrivivax albus]RVT54279.1 Fe-S protein assembly co-chaperone HscB [Rubrivivax albus]
MNLSDDDFTLFDLPQRFAVDRAELDARWRALQSEAHPDRFAADGASAQRLAMQWSVRINEAYRRLKDPLARATYLCELRGAPVRAEDNTAMPAAFLMQQMAWREALDEAETLDAVEALNDDVRADERRRLASVAAALDDVGDATAAAAEVRALMFVARFRQDIARRLEALEH